MSLKTRVGRSSSRTVAERGDVLSRRTIDRGDGFIENARASKQEFISNRGDIQDVPYFEDDELLELLWGGVTPVRAMESVNGFLIQDTLPTVTEKNKPLVESIAQAWFNALSTVEKGDIPFEIETEINELREWMSKNGIEVSKSVNYKKSAEYKHAIRKLQSRANVFDNLQNFVGLELRFVKHFAKKVRLADDYNAAKAQTFKKMLSRDKNEFIGNLMYNVTEASKKQSLPVPLEEEIKDSKHESSIPSLPPPPIFTGPPYVRGCKSRFASTNSNGRK